MSFMKATAFLFHFETALLACKRLAWHYSFATHKCRWWTMTMQRLLRYSHNMNFPICSSINLSFKRSSDLLENLIIIGIHSQKRRRCRSYYQFMSMKSISSACFNDALLFRLFQWLCTLWCDSIYVAWGSISQLFQTNNPRNRSAIMERYDWLCAF